VDAGSSNGDRAIKKHLQRHPKFLRYIRVYVSYNVSAFLWLLPRLSEVNEVKLRWNFSGELGNPLPRIMNLLGSSTSTNNIAELDLNVYISHDEHLLRHIRLFKTLRILRIRIPQQLRYQIARVDVPQAARRQLTAAKLLGLLKSPTLEHLIVDGVDRRLPPISRQNLPNLRSTDLRLNGPYSKVKEYLPHLTADLKQQKLYFRIRLDANQTPNTYEVLIATLYGNGYPYTYSPSWPPDPHRIALLTSFLDSMLYMNATFGHADNLAIARTSPRDAELERIRTWLTDVCDYPTTFSVCLSGKYFFITPKSPTHFIFQIPEYHADWTLQYFISQMSTLRRVEVTIHEHCNIRSASYWTSCLPKNRTGWESWGFTRRAFREKQRIDSMLPHFHEQRTLWFQECMSLESVQMIVHYIDADHQV
jgi:hypothetical protein